MSCGRAQEARDLAAEIRAQLKRGGYSDKDTKELLRQKDELIGSVGQHHRIRNVGANQIAGDLEDFADSGNHD